MQLKHILLSRFLFLIYHTSAQGKYHVRRNDRGRLHHTPCEVNNSCFWAHTPPAGDRVLFDRWSRCHGYLEIIG